MQHNIYQKYNSRPKSSSEDEVERLRRKFCYEVDLIKVEDTLFALEGVSSWDVEQTLMHFVEKGDSEVIQAVKSLQAEIRQVRANLNIV